MAKERVEIVVSAKIDGLTADMTKAKESISAFESKVDKASDSTEKLSLASGKLGHAAKGAGVAVAALSAAIGVLVKKQLEAARTANLWSARLGVARSSFSQLAAVGAKFGASVDDVGDAIKDLNERIADAARGNKTYEEALNLVGMKSKELINLPVDQQFLKVADAIGKMTNAGDQNFVTAELMADAGFRLIPMFQQGEKAIREMGGALLKTNHALSEVQLKQLEDVNTALMSMSRSTEALGNALAIHLAPGLKLAAEWAEKLSGVAADLLGTSETGMRDRLKEVNEQLDKMGKRSLPSGKAGTRAYVRQMGQYRDYIALLQERERIENGLKSMEESSIAEKPSQTGPTMATMPTMVDMGVTGGTVGPMQGPEADKEVKDLLLQNLLDYQKNEWEYKNDQRGRELEANRSFWDSMLMIDERAKNANAALWESGWRGKMNVASKFMGQMSTLMNTNSRKQFEIGKAAAIAQVAIDTPKAAMAAYSAMAGIPIIGPALGIAASVAAIASGASQIQNIKSQTFGGGSVGGGGIVGASGGAGGGGAQQAAPENVLDATFNIQGSSVSADSVRQLGSSLKEYIDDGFRLRSVQVV